MASGVRVQRARLGPGWGGSFDDITLRITPDRPIPALRRLLERAVDDLRAAVRTVGLAGVATVPPRSAVIPVAWCDTQVDLDQLIDALVVWLDDHDVAGVVDGYASTGPFYESTVDKPAFGGIAVVVSPRLRPDAVSLARGRPGSTFQYLYEAIDPDAFELVVDHALRWCDVPGGTHWLQSWMTSVTVPVEGRQALLMDHLGAAGRVNLICERWPTERRTVDFDVDGRVIYTVGSGSRVAEWPQLLRTSQQILADLAEAAPYGFAVRSPVPVPSVELLMGRRNWVSLHDPDIDRSLRWMRLDDSRVPEAFVTQLLSRHDLSAADLTAWDVVPVGDGAVLLTHREPARWLAGDRPEESVVRAARETLRPLLLGYDDEQAERTAVTGFPPFRRPGDLTSFAP
jgi:hypothetical protein